MTYTSKHTKREQTGDAAQEDVLGEQWPVSPDAESGLLGSLLLDGDAITRIRRIVRPLDCHSEAHRVLLQALGALDDAGIAIDLITVVEYLERRGELAAAGGQAYVSSLPNQVPTSANVEAYARAVANTAGLRRLLALSGKFAALAVQEPDAQVALTQAQQMFQEVLRGALSDQQEAQSYGVLLDSLFADLLDRMEQPEASGILTGIPSLDAQLGGLEPGDLIYLCGRPGSGKSALGVTLATGIARRFTCQWQDRQTTRRNPATGELLPPDPEAVPQAVDIVTLEMRDLQQVRRIVAAVTNINSRALRTGFRLPDGQVDAEAYHLVKTRAYADRPTLEHTLFLYGRPITLEALRAFALHAVATRNTAVLVIDQLDLISDDPSGRRGQRTSSEYDRITTFSRALKQLALEAQIVIICLTQLNRKVEERQNRRPMKTDLRSSGQLEQDADFVLGLYRGAYYDKQRARKEPRFGEFAELLLLKVREGEDNVMTPLRYEGAFTRFSEWPEEWEWPADETRGMEG